MTDKIETAEQTTAEIEIFVVVDEDGECEVGINPEDAKERFGDGISSYSLRHMIRMKITVPLPQPIDVEAALPVREDGNYELVIKQS